MEQVIIGKEDYLVVSTNKSGSYRLSALQLDLQEVMSKEYNVVRS